MSRAFGYSEVSRAVIALAITVAMMALTAFNVTTMLNAALLATVAMLLSGCLTTERIWRSLDWPTVVVLGAAVGLELWLTGSGLSTSIADLLSSLGGHSPRMTLAVVFFAAVVMTNTISHAAAAVFMFPVALSMADKLGVRFLPFAIILMMGASRLHQSRQLSNQSHGSGARWIQLWRFRQGRTASHGSRGCCRAADCSSSLRVLRM